MSTPTTGLLCILGCSEDTWPLAWPVLATGHGGAGLFAKSVSYYIFKLYDHSQKKNSKGTSSSVTQVTQHSESLSLTAGERPKIDAALQLAQTGYCATELSVLIIAIGIT